MGNDLRSRVTNGGQVAQRNDQPPTLQGSIQMMESQFQLAMPKGVEAQQLVRDALTVIRQTPKLAECERNSVMGSLMTCAQLGLRPGVLGQAYLLPLWNGRNRRMEAQLIIGYQGLLELIYRSGMVTMVDARVIHENDEWTFTYGLEADELVHRPPLSGPRGNPVAFYAVARTKNGGVFFEPPMSVADMEDYRDQYAMAKKKDGTVVGPWVSEFVEMAKKTMIRRLAKRLPKSPEVAQAITHDGAVRFDPTPAGINTEPSYINGTVEPPNGEMAEQAPTSPPEPEKQGTDTQYPPEDAGPAQQWPEGETKPPTKAALTRLSKAFTEQGFGASDGSRDEWLANALQAPGITIRDLTAQQVDEAHDLLTGK